MHVKVRASHFTVNTNQNNYFSDGILVRDNNFFPRQHSCDMEPCVRSYLIDIFKSCQF